MENTRFLKITIIVLLVVNIATLVFMWTGRNGGPRPPHGGGPPRIAEYLTEELKLSEEQQKQFKELRDSNHERIQEINEKNGKLHKAYFEMLGASPVDMNKVSLIADSMSAYTKQIELLTFEHFQKVRGMCDPTQQKKFDLIIQDALRMMAPPKGGPGPR